LSLFLPHLIIPLRTLEEQTFSFLLWQRSSSAKGKNCHKINSKKGWFAETLKISKGVLKMLGSSRGLKET